MKHFIQIIILLLLPVTAPLLRASPVAPPSAEALPGVVVTLTGIFNTVWGDPPPGSGLPPTQRYFLAAEGSQTWELLMDEENLREIGGATTVNGEVVVVEGRAVPHRRQALSVDTITTLYDIGGPGAKGRDLLGSQGYLWILMRFADIPDTPEDPYWFAVQALGDYPSMDHYWKEVSYGCIDMGGSLVKGWYDLPYPRSYYVYDINPEDPGDELDHQRLLDDAIALVDPIVDFRNFEGFHMIVNAWLDDGAYGGRGVLTLDGETREWGFTWMPEWGWRNQDVMAHESGHSFGLPHSSGPYGEVYDSRWDVMSLACGTCTEDDPEYGNLAVNTISYHKDRLGWIHPEHHWEFSTNPFVQKVWLYDLARVPPEGGLLMATVPWPSNPDRYYTLERRRRTGYDQNLPGESVIIHSVDPSRANPAWVVDADMDGDCNDEGAMWEPCESYCDLTHGIVVTVECASESYSYVTLTNAARNTVYVDLTNSGDENGSPDDPWDKFWEGAGAVYPGGDVYIEPGLYTDNLVLCKSMELRRWGSSGAVTIGD